MGIDNCRLPINVLFPRPPAWTISCGALFEVAPAIFSASDAVYVRKIGSRLLFRQPLALGIRRESVREVFALGFGHEARQLAPAIHDFVSLEFARENRVPVEPGIDDDRLHDPDEVAGIPPVLGLRQELLRRIENLCRASCDAQDLTSRLDFFIVIPGLVPGTYDGMKKPRIGAAIGGRDKPGHDALGFARRLRGYPKRRRHLS